MCENFMSSEFDALFTANSIKVCFSGASYREIDECLETAIGTHPNIKSVLRALDYSWLVKDKNAMHYHTRPDYLYDNTVLNDGEYLFNDDVIKECLSTLWSTRKGKAMTTFDEYSNWNDQYTYGKEAVLATYTRDPSTHETVMLSDEEREMIRGNIRQNVTSLAADHPGITFYLFFPPYSICYWDEMNQAGKISWQIEAEKIAIEELLKYDNIKLFSFNSNHDLICDLNNYKDQAHYREEINSMILAWIKEGKFEITAENYNQYLDGMDAFFSTYDYDAIHE